VEGTIRRRLKRGKRRGVKHPWLSGEHLLETETSRGEGSARSASDRSQGGGRGNIIKEKFKKRKKRKEMYKKANKV